MTQTKLMTRRRWSTANSRLNFTYLPLKTMTAILFCTAALLTTTSYNNCGA